MSIESILDLLLGSHISGTEFKPEIYSSDASLTASEDTHDTTTKLVPLSDDSEMPKNKKPTPPPPKKHPKPHPKMKSAGYSSQALAPVAVSTRTVSTAPSMSRNNRGNSFRVKHTELISGSIAGSTAFTVQSSYYLNPGLALTFPWLAPQAAQWEQYRFHSLNFLYVPIAPTSAQGDVLLIPVYDAQSPSPLTEVQAANNAGSVTDSCWKTSVCRLNPSSMGAGASRKFVRTGQTAGDLKTFDSGRIFICTNNETGTTAVGKLFVNYDVEFFIPNSEPQLPSTSIQTFCASMSGGAVAYATGVVNNMPTMTTLFDPINIGAPTTAGSYSSYTPPAGTYHFTYQVTMKDTANESMTVELFCYVAGVEYTVNSTTFRASLINYAATTNITSTITLVGCVVITAGQGFSIGIKPTGAAGTLTAVDAQLVMVVC